TQDQHLVFPGLDVEFAGQAHRSRLCSAFPFFSSFFSSTYGPITRASRPVEKKVRTASTGEQTIGSPTSLNEVLSTIGTPVSRWNASMRRRNGGLAASVTVWRRPVPSTWVTAGTCARRSGRIGRQSSMNGEGATGSNHAGASSARTEGANGRKG